jgi:hypothetical protein
VGNSEEEVKRRMLTVSENEHEHQHVFLVEDQTFDEETSVPTKRCACGFSIQVELEWRKISLYIQMHLLIV